MAVDVPSEPCTRRPSQFQFAIASRIDYVNARHWDEVTEGGSIFMSRRFLRNAQDDFVGQIVRDFAIVYDNGRPVAAVATQSFDVCGEQLFRNKADQLKLLPSEWKRKSLSLLKRRITMCGNVHTWGPDGVAFAPECDPTKSWPGVADCLYRIRRANRLHGQTDYVIVKDLFENHRQSAGELAAFRYTSLETEPNMVLTIPESWQSFDDYLGSLTKRYRAAARKVFKPFDHESFEVTPVEDLHAESQALYSLYQSVAQRADVCLFSLQPSTLPRMADALGDDFIALGIRQNRRLVGFVTVIRDGDTAIGFYLGMDYDANATLPIYHRLLLAVIEQAIRWRCRRISFGRTALDAKSRLGCKPEATHVWVRHRVPLLNVFVQQMLKNVGHEEPPERNPFKDAE
ncbi:GNAT family N-acetyltransferase [Aporhodopirellula aestuarii]|uniref:GNAT family N-acetyltransferase n=1 Tax=Aporhodopirellula aestuarii TaxID=2950107 RepID=A0ABT0U400_9BACT|nr:GNAT family N-acetyltransferase [Aporhodopirellula aestuarii]MCM2371275.1 GNAT family N-acetyltransferase [Aporhodopirellula aestuarii]